MRTMYDGTNWLAAGIHRAFPNAQLVAGYVNGAYAWDAAEWLYFPAADRVTISVFASANVGDVIDCETGDATPVGAAEWVRMRRAAGLFRPTVYVQLSSIQAVRDATGSLKLGTDYDIWCADWDGTTGLPYPLVAAKQDRSTPGYDVSAVYDNLWPHRLNNTAGNTGPYWPPAVTLLYGSTGTAVKALQEALDATNHYGCRGLKADGVYGLMTRTAVGNFQAWQRITIDREAGPQVRGKLVQGGWLKP